MYLVSKADGVKDTPDPVADSVAEPGGGVRRVVRAPVDGFGSPLRGRVGRGKRAGRATERSGRVDRRLWEGYQ